MKKLSWFLAPLLALGMSLGMAAPAFAASNDASLTTSAVISVGGFTLNVAGGTATMQSIVVNSNNFVATLLPGSTLSVSGVSTLTYPLSTVGSTIISTTVCSATNSVLTITGGTGSSVTTVTPASGTTCAITGPTSGGGGGGAPSVTTTSSTTPTTITPDLGCIVGALFSSTTGKACSTSSVVGTTVTATSGTTGSSVTQNTPRDTKSSAQMVGNSTKTFKVGSKGVGVTALQILLATDPSVYPEGTVSGLFGPKTLKAVKRFQVKYGLSGPGKSGYGTIGQKTKAKLLQLYG
jgi:hypothetical protein